VLKRFYPAYRFGRVGETVIARNHCPRSRLNEASIKVLNWNIAKNNHDELWIDDFLSILQLYDPDLIFLQEVRLCRKTQKLAQLTEMNWNFAPNFIDTYHNTYCGILTAAKAECKTKKSIASKHYEPIAKTPKISLLSEYPLSNRHDNLLAINTHLINFVELDSFRAQLHQLQTAIAHHKGIVIFAGDFNTWNQSRWLLLNKMTKQLGLNQVEFAPSDTQKIKRFFFSPPLDYIFYRGLEPIPFTAEVLDSISSSDHKPLLVEFSV
jgi:endonuclease/exonuclease/phosphatase (EEP) superfamily protein YafD